MASQRGHRYVGGAPIRGPRDVRHWGGEPPKVEPVQAAPQRDDLAIEREKAQAKLREQHRRGRRATILTPSDYGSTPAPAAAPGLSGTRATLG